jgi:hypothetical protein
MILKVDTINKVIVYNEKLIPVDLFVSLKLAPLGSGLEVIEAAGPDGIVTVKLIIPK